MFSSLHRIHAIVAHSSVFRFLGFRERRENEDYVTLARDRLRQISWKLVHVGALRTE